MRSVVCCVALLCLVTVVQCTIPTLPFDSNVTGTVTFEGDAWLATFVPEQWGSVTVTGYITGPADTDAVIRMYLGLGYIPSSHAFDAIGDVIDETTGIEFWSSIRFVLPAINNSAPAGDKEARYYLAVEDDLLPTVSFTLRASFTPLPPPTITPLELGDEPLPGTVSRGQLTQYTFKPDSEGNVFCQVQWSSPDSTGILLINPNTAATWGNSQWAQTTDRHASQVNATAKYVRTDTTYYVSVFGMRGTDHDNDDYSSIDKYYIACDKPKQTLFDV